MSRTSVIISMILLVALPILAQDAFELGITAYNDEEYQDAIAHFSTALQANSRNGAAHYNLGNAYYRVGQFGQARYHYEMALLLSPGDEDARHNIDLIEQQVLKPEMRAANFVGFGVTMRRLLEVVNPRLMFWLAAGSFIMLNLLVVLRILKPATISVTALWIAIIPLGLAFLFAVAVVGGFHILDDRISFGVIIAPASNAYSEPSVRAPGTFPVPAAVKARIKRQRESWLEIALPDNTTGWVPAEDIAVIEYAQD